MAKKKKSEIIQETVEVSETDIKEEQLEEVRSVEEVSLPVEGSESECKVMLIKIGPFGKLFDIEKVKDPEIRESMYERANRLAIQITCQEKMTKEVFTDTIIFSFHPRARYPKIASRYGKIKLGDTLKCRVEGGRWKIV